MAQAMEEEMAAELFDLLWALMPAVEGWAGSLTVQEKLRPLKGRFTT